jgi:hypothetical protein
VFADGMFLVLCKEILNVKFSFSILKCKTWRFEFLFISRYFSLQSTWTANPILFLNFNIVKYICGFAAVFKNALARESGA